MFGLDEEREGRDLVLGGVVYFALLEVALNLSDK